MLLLLHARTHLYKKKKKKKFAPVTRMVVVTRRSLHPGGLSTEGERSSMVEDAPTAAEHGRRRRVMGTVRGAVPGEVSLRGIH
jgi:hypothetical protein